jgi:hypothetical protein
MIKAGNLILKGEVCFEFKKNVRADIRFGCIFKSFCIVFITFYLSVKYEFGRWSRIEEIA